MLGSFSESQIFFIFSLEALFFAAQRAKLTFKTIKKK